MSLYVKIKRDNNKKDWLKKFSTFLVDVRVVNVEFVNVFARITDVSH